MVRLSGTALELAGSSIDRHLEGAVAVAVLAVTAGMGVDAELRRLSLTDRVGQLLLDAAGTALVERAADAAEASVVARAAGRGLFANGRFSPGYGDLPLATPAGASRHARRAAAPGDHALVLPAHDAHQGSVTAVIGLFREPRAAGRPGCAECACREFCSLRAAGTTCRG